MCGLTAFAACDASSTEPPRDALFPCGASGRVTAVVMTAVLDTSRPRAGRRFEPTHELALQGDALHACELLPGARRGVIVVREMTGPIGIPDLTALVGSHRALDARIRLDVPPLLNQLDAAIVAAAPARGGCSVEAISAALGWPNATIERRVPGLLRAGAIAMSTRGELRRHSALRPLGRLFAVEAKVRDRGAAIQQARAYASWADAYVLVMGELGARPLAQLCDDVDQDNGGLMIAGRWVRRPVVRALPPGRRLLASEHFYAAILSGSYQPSVLA